MNTSRKTSICCLALLGITLLGCGVPVDSSPRDATLSFSGKRQPESPSQVSIPKVELPDNLGLPHMPPYKNWLYFHDPGVDRLFPVSYGSDTEPTPVQVLEMLLAGVMPAAAYAAGLETFLPGMHQVSSISSAAGYFEVDFKSATELKQLTNRQLYLAVGQLVASLAGSTHITSVGISINGQLQELPTQQGIVQRPVTVEDYQDLLSLKLPHYPTEAAFASYPPELDFDRELPATPSVTLPQPATQPAQPAAEAPDQLIPPPLTRQPDN